MMQQKMISLHKPGNHNHEPTEKQTTRKHG